MTLGGQFERPDLGRLLGFVGEKGTQERGFSAAGSTHRGVVRDAV